MSDEIKVRAKVVQTKVRDGLILSDKWTYDQDTQSVVIEVFKAVTHWLGEIINDGDLTERETQLLNALWERTEKL